MESWEEELVDADLSELSGLDDLVNDLGLDQDVIAKNDEILKAAQQQAEAARAAEEEKKRAKEATIAASLAAKRTAEEKAAAATAERLAATADSSLRSPICAVLGHVDTGKTSLLDKLRATSVQAGEAGGITQQIGATYMPIEQILSRIDSFGIQLDYKIPGLLVIDTPGHESFSNLRSRGSTLCDVAVLVIDIMHGIEAQTRESLELLKKSKAPFIIALNKVDRLSDWRASPDAPFKDSFKNQRQFTKDDFETRWNQIYIQLIECGVFAELYWKNKNPKKNVYVCPTSAHSGEGIADLLAILVSLSQKFLTDRIKLTSELSCSVLERKVIEGHGATIDVILSDGIIHEGDQIVVCGYDGPIVTTIRALLTPKPMKEIRVGADYVHHKEIRAAMGIKIAANNLEHAVAGTNLFVAHNEEEVAKYSKLVMNDIENLRKKIKAGEYGVHVQASTVGSLEALIEFLRGHDIPIGSVSIGPIHKKDVVRASLNFKMDTSIFDEDQLKTLNLKKYGVILAFDVKMTPEAELEAEATGVKVYTAPIIYHLYDKYTKLCKELDMADKAERTKGVILPIIAETIAVFKNSDPVILGVEAKMGTILTKGAPMKIFSKDSKSWVDLGPIHEIRKEGESVQTAKAGEQVTLSFNNYSIKSDGRDLERNGGQMICTAMRRQDIEAIKYYLKEEAIKNKWLPAIKQIKEWLQLNEE